MYFARGRSTIIGGGTGILTIKQFENNFPSVKDVIVKINSQSEQIYPTEIYNYVVKVRDPSTQSKLIPIESGVGRLTAEDKFERIRIDNTYNNNVYKYDQLTPIDINVNSVLEIVGYNLDETIKSRSIITNTNALANDKILTNDTSNNLIVTINKDMATEGLVFQQLSDGTCQVDSGPGVEFIDLNTGDIVTSIVTSGIGHQVLVIKTGVNNKFIVSNSTFTPLNQALYTNQQKDIAIGVVGVDSQGKAVLLDGSKTDIGYDVKPIKSPPGFTWTNHNLNLRRKKLGQVIFDLDTTKLIPNYTNVWYVDPINGNDATAVANNRNLPLLNIATALAKTELNPFAIVVINLTADYIGRGLKSFNGVQPTQKLAVFIESGFRYISVKSSLSTAPTWTVNSTFSNVYETTLTSANSNTVVDLSLKSLPSFVDNSGTLVTITTAPKRFRALTKVASIADVAATAGTWYNDGTKTYVRAHDDRNLINDNNMQPLSSGDNLRYHNSQDNNVFYVQGVDFVGGNPVRSAPITFTATAGNSGQPVINTNSTTGLVTGMEVTGTGISSVVTIQALSPNVSVQLTGNLGAVASGIYTAYFKNNTLVLDNCSVQMSNTASNGLSVQLPGTNYLFNTWSYNSGKDGFSYSSPQADAGITLNTSPFFIEAMCGSTGSGITGSAGPNDNATSSNDRSVGISVGCYYLDSADRVLIGNDYSRRWVLDTIIGQAIRVGTDKESIGALGLTGQAIWLDTVTTLTGSNSKWVSKETTGQKSTIYYYNSGNVINSTGNTGNLVPYQG